MDFREQVLGRNTPLSLAPELEMVLEQEGFAEWREQGGYTWLATGWENRLFAVTTAHLWRNFPIGVWHWMHLRPDMIFCCSIVSVSMISGRQRKQNIKETIGFFQDRYISDPDFATQVDEAVRRILRVKQRLYMPHLPLSDEGVSADNAERSMRKLRVPGKRWIPVKGYSSLRLHWLMCW